MEQKLVHIPDRGEPGGGSGAQSGFGTSLAISGDRLAVAGPTTERGGRAFLYEFSEAQWQLRLELQAVEP